ncbi:exodeoxyribonuclease VII small subunit [Fodinibius sediminis]|uniref:Exodeoxyribonuclease 7 small subunit n=1 Tax=Fodinibius sediminis TaxID=1214077 RepID=A0A521AL67_9BACT|nr:exodeoxyribonuclease VII small subunit [Fodinibius sediminis]SMO35604.1 Exodeoxyribonuclease VII small subunit [Fodinibius sediminis]
MSNKEPLGFEEALARLETIVEELEDDSITLDKSIELYEEGIELSKLCTETLEEAELRIEKVAEQQVEENDNQ